MLMQLEAGGLTSASSHTRGRGLDGRMGPISVEHSFSLFTASAGEMGVRRLLTTGAGFHQDCR